MVFSVAHRVSTRESSSLVCHDSNIILCYIGADKFLPVGHTHEDIDQLFSKIGEEICHKGCESLLGS